MSTLDISINNPGELKKKNARMLIWVANASIVMMFAALTSAYLVGRTAEGWLYFELPSVFWYSTAFILLSSITMFIAQYSIKQGNNNGLKVGLTATLILGVAFAATQLHALFDVLYNSGIYFTGKGSNVSGQFLYFIAIFHLLHLTFGLLSLLFTLVKAVLNKYTKENYIGVEVSAIYWHFLDVLWIYLFVFLLFIR